MGRPVKKKPVRRNRLGLRVTEHRTNRMLDAFEKEFVMWSWRKRPGEVYELIRDEMQMPGGIIGNMRAQRMAPPDFTYSTMQMLGKVSNDQDARRHFCDIRNRASMMKALEAL